MSDTVQFIVNALNQSPFSKGLTLVSFDKKSGPELIQILQDVIQEISEDQRIPLRDETPDITAQRIFDFLWMIKYKAPVGDPYIFKTGLMEGDRKVIYPALYWLLPRIAELRKRAYLEKYLISVDVPPEISNEEVYMEFKQRQSDFKEVHKAVEKIRSSGFQPSDLRTQITELEKQKEKLRDKLESMKKKLDKIPNRQQLLEAAEKLRAEEDEQRSLSDNFEEQKVQLQQAEQRLQREKEKLKELQNYNMDGGIDSHLRKLAEEVDTNTYLAQKLPQERESKIQWIENLRRVLNEPTMTEQERQRMQGQISTLRQQIKTLQAKKDASSNKVDDKLAFYRQQFNAAEKKKTEKENALRDLFDEKAELEKEHNEKEEHLKQLNPTKQLLRGEALDKYVQDLRRKTIVYKKYKAEQSQIKTEQAILSRTLEIIQLQEGRVRGSVEKIEEARGVRGFQETYERLEQVSQMKGEIDSEKGKTLEEISKIVVEINNSIKERKDKLAPQIRALRTIRTEATELETIYNEQKTIYDNAMLSVTNESERLNVDREAFSADSAKEESRYHYLHCMSMILDMNMVKAKYGEDGSGPTFQDIYQAEIAAQEAKGKTLREKQKTIKETHEPNLQQLEMFSDLKNLFKAKLKMRSSENQMEEGGSSEPNRLVL